MLRISDCFKVDTFNKMGLKGSSKDWQTLVKGFMDYAKGKPLGNTNDVVVSVVEGNNIALRLYKKMGFKIIGKDKYGHIALSQTI